MSSQGHGKALELLYPWNGTEQLFEDLMIPFRTLITFLALVSGVLTSWSVFAYETVFDRLDGTGPSKKRVDVIEWDGNLEIHVYPKGSLKGLGVKLDDRESGKKVMVISYDLKDSSEPLVRRAILGIPFTSKIKAFIDSSEGEFDKIGLSNQELGKPWKNYKLQAPPKKWGPDGSKFDEDSRVEFKITSGERLLRLHTSFHQTC